MEARTDGQINKHKQTDRQKYGKMERQTNTKRRTDRNMEAQTDKQPQKDRQTEQKDRIIEESTDRQTNRQANRSKEERTDRQTDRLRLLKKPDNMKYSKRTSKVFNPKFVKCVKMGLFHPIIS
jgi:hypothetical protein